MAVGEEKLRIVKRYLKSRVDELNALSTVSKLITSSDNLNKMLNLIIRKVATIVNADICIIHLLQVNKRGLTPNTVYGIKKGRGSLLNLPRILKKGEVTERVIRTKQAVIVNDVFKHRKDPFCNVCQKEKMRSILIVPLVERDNVIGTLTCCSRKREAYTKDDEKELVLFANQIAIAIENSRLLDQIKINYLNTMKLLTSIIDSKDRYTEDHSERVMQTALNIADVLKLSDEQKSIIRYASLLHDIGKIAIDSVILRKTAPLTREEWAEIMRHPTIGADIIKKAGFLDDLIPSILYHHVRYDGGGYPITKKKKNAIPIEARILAVADAYGAMRSERPYRKRLSREEAISELKRNSGTQFDPKVVKAFLKCLRYKRYK